MLTFVNGMFMFYREFWHQFVFVDGKSVNSDGCFNILEGRVDK